MSKTQFKNFSILTFAIMVITAVLTVLSIFALTLVLHKMCDYSFCFSSKGLSNFLFQFKVYNELFAANLGALTILAVLMQFDESRSQGKLIMATSNGNLRFKYYTEELEKLKKINGYLYRYLALNSERIFDNYVLNAVSIKNKKQLAKIMDDFFGEQYHIIEEQHIAFIIHGGAEQDVKSYSYHDSRDIFRILVHLDQYRTRGTNFYEDFQCHYFKRIKELREKRNRVSVP